MSTLGYISSNSPIGFFDSGVGGLTVLDKVKKLLPFENYIFYGDTIHVPYGSKSKEELLSYSEKILKFFEKKRCKAVVMACNTTSSVIYDDIKDKYNFELYPVVQSVSKMLSTLPVNILGVFGTKVTIESDAYPREIAKYNSSMKVCGQYCPEWVKIVENNLLNDASSINTVKNDLNLMLKNNPEKIVLGCTHYPYLLSILSKFAPIDMFIDPAVYLAEYIKNDLKLKSLIATSNNGTEEFYVSSNPKQFRISASMFYKLEENPQLLVL